MFAFLKNLIGRKPEAVPKPSTEQHRSEPPSKAAPIAPVAAGDGMLLPLRPIVAGLPDKLKSAVVKPPGASVEIAVSRARVLTQLPQGRVQVSFGEIRQASPANVFAGDSAFDAALVDLPLAEVLARIAPANLQRRPAQRRIEIPDEVAPIFGPGGVSLNVARDTGARVPGAPAAASTAPATPAVRTDIAQEPVSRAHTAAPVAAPAPAPAVPVSKPITPAIPLPPPSAPAAPVMPKAAAPAAPPASEDTIVVALAEISGAWPEPLRTDAGRSPCSVAFSVAELEPMMRRGKVLFRWDQIRERCTVAPPEVAIEKDTTLEVPLAVVAPLFLAKKKPAPSQKKVVISEAIPMVFSRPPATPASPVEAQAATPLPSGGIVTVPSVPDAPAPFGDATSKTAPSTAPAPSKESATPAPQPAVPVISPAPASSVPRPVLEFGEIFGHPAKRQWTPHEVMHATTHLKGISGAVLSTRDGLLIASALPPDLAGEKVAAFIPQMYGRMTQYAKELGFGGGGQFTFLSEGVAFQIFGVADGFFAVIGRSGEALPRIQLAAIAARLSKPV